MESDLKKKLFKYLSGKASLFECQVVENWILQPQNSENFYKWLLEFESKYPQFAPDLETALKNVFKKLKL